jgi:hypothetical protein
MPVPVFTSGEILTAANMNAVGLWRITGCTVTSSGGTSATASNGVITLGSGNTSVTINNAFSANFDRYKIVLSGGVASTPLDIRCHLGSSTPASGYFGFLVYGAYNSTAVQGFNQNNTANWGYIGTGSVDALEANCEIDNPFATKRSFIFAQNALALATTGSANTFAGFLNDNTSYTAFTLSASTGTMTGGQVRVYGYNK